MHYGPVMIDLSGTALTPLEENILRHKAVGGVLLFTRNYTNKAQIQTLVRHIRKIADKEVLIAVDHEGGRVWRFEEGFSKLPESRLFGTFYKEDPFAAQSLAQQAGFLMAAELLECGIDLSLAPILDVDRGVSEIIASRGFHDTPEVISILGAAFIKGMNKAGMQATGKHFPGHGGCALDSHIDKPLDNRRLDLLLREDILPFKQLSAQLGAIMPAHVVYPKIDSLPAGFSKIWLQDILREQLNFTGAIISDCLSMKAAELESSLLENAMLALNAGCDMIIVAQQTREHLKDFLEALLYEISDERQDRLKGLAGQFGKIKHLGSELKLAKNIQYSL